MSLKKPIPIPSIPPVMHPLEAAAYRFLEESYPHGRNYEKMVSKTRRRDYVKDLREKSRFQPITSINTKIASEKILGLKKVDTLNGFDDPGLAKEIEQTQKHQASYLGDQPFIGTKPPWQDFDYYNTYIEQQREPYLDFMLNELRQGKTEALNELIYGRRYEMPGRMGIPEHIQAGLEADMHPRDISRQSNELVAQRRAEMADPRSAKLKEALARVFGSRR